MTSQSENGQNFVRIISPTFPLAQTDIVRESLIPVSPPHRAVNQMQSHNFEFGQTAMRLGVTSAKIILNWGQHAELKLQAVSFIHIKLGKGAKMC